MEKPQRPPWARDETVSAGVDYQAVNQAQRYDEVHQRFRDYAKAAENVITRLGLGPDSTVIDLGAGTGAFAVHAAKYCKKVYAVDVSQAMLEVCQTKLAQAGLQNVICRLGGFLTYEHQDDPVEAMVSVAALHHLPDHWKQVGLNRAAQMIKSGGRLYLFDIVFPSESPNLSGLLDGWMASIRQNVGDELAVETAIHVRDEYSTYDWIMEGLLRRAGFQIDEARYDQGFQTTYICTKP
jgi:cyclopropane fatty-acyl-phospholipid synthase-like methyltransferase